MGSGSEGVKEPRTKLHFHPSFFSFACMYRGTYISDLGFPALVSHIVNLLFLKTLKSKVIPEFSHVQIH